MIESKYYRDFYSSANIKLDCLHDRSRSFRTEYGATQINSQTVILYE